MGGGAFLSQPEGRSYESWERSVRGARRPKTTGHKARVTGGHRAEYAFYLVFVRVYVTPSQRRMPQVFFFFFFFLQREKERVGAETLATDVQKTGHLSTDSSSRKGSGNSGGTFRFNKGRLPTCKTTEPNKSRLRKGLAGTA